MTAFWKLSGLSYTRFSNLCAQAVRRSIKEGHPEKNASISRERGPVNVLFWKDGKASAIKKE